MTSRWLAAGSWDSLKATETGSKGARRMWLLHTSVNERRALTASFLGYGLDGFDLMMYSCIIPTLLGVWHLSHEQAGDIATAALITSGIGSWAASAALVVLPAFALPETRGRSLADRLPEPEAAHV